MLVSLSIRDFVLIEKLDLNFSRSSGAAATGGLGALTGETGAGKSILIAGLEKQGEAVRAAWHAGRSAEQAHADAEAAAAAARRDEDFLRHAVKELAVLSPKPDDEETLAGERQLLRAGGALGEAVAQALAELEQGRGAATALRSAHRLIERNVDKAMGRLDSALAALERALSEALQAQAHLDAP